MARSRPSTDHDGALASSWRSFVMRETRLQSVPGLGGMRLHLADDALGLWRAVQQATGDDDAPLPYWGFAWSGGLALAQYLQERPATVDGKRVLDLASGSGLVAIAAMRAGADRVFASDTDPFAHAAIERNARANHVRITVVPRDLLDEAPPDVDVILAGDCFYEAGLAGRAAAWFARAHSAGIPVLIGDPGRRYLPTQDLLERASYEVRTTTELEDLASVRASVHAWQGRSDDRG